MINSRVCVYTSSTDLWRPPINDGNWDRLSKNKRVLKFQPSIHRSANGMQIAFERVAPIYRKGIGRTVDRAGWKFDYDATVNKLNRYEWETNGRERNY